MTRRTLMQSAATLAAATAVPAQPPPSKLKICVFSKHLQFLEGEALAKATKEMGFDGIILSSPEGPPIVLTPETILHLHQL